MSRVTNVILTTAAGEEQIEAFNAAWDWDGGPQFQDVPSDIPAGTKHLECNVYLGAFNHLDLNAFVSAIRRTAWDCPESVQIFILEEDSERFVEVSKPPEPPTEDFSAYHNPRGPY
jgi:hypothetical protein